MLLRPEKMKKKTKNNQTVWIYFLNYTYTLETSGFSVSSNSQVVLGKTAMGTLL